MKRLLRIILNIAALLSLILCLATATLWMRSYWVGDHYSIRLPQFSHPLADSTFNITSGRGGIRFTFDRWERWELGVQKPSRAEIQIPAILHSTVSPHYPYALNTAIFRGFGCEISRARESFGPNAVGSGIVSELNLVMPAVIPFIATSVLPLIWWRHQGKSARLRRIGFCPICNYDLRATPDRCPECGAVPTAKQDATPYFRS